MDMTGCCAEIHMRTDANNLVTTASTTHLPDQKETVHMIQNLRQEACSGNMLRANVLEKQDGWKHPYVSHIFERSVRLLGQSVDPVKTASNDTVRNRAGTFSR